MQVVVGGQGFQQFDVGARQPGVPEQAQPRWQRLGGGLAQPGDGVAVPDVRRIDPTASTSARHSGGCQLQVGVQVARRAALPVDQQLRPLAGVGGEQPGEPVRHRVTPTPAQLRLVVGVEVAQMRCQRGAPRLIQAGVDDREQRPAHRIRRPRIIIARAGDLGDQRDRAAELHARTHPVAAGAGAQYVRQALGQPAFHPAGRHQHQLLGERVGRWRRQQRAEAIGEDIGAFGAVQV